MEDFPLSFGALERYRLAARKRAPAGQVGAHLVRRKGQSLEFHDFAQYRPGDDFRHIDWRASARLRRPAELLVRRFEAEDQLTLAISIDHRSSMGLLETAPKLRLACWLAYALATIAARGRDRILLHRLFGPAAGSIETITGVSALPRVRRFLEGLLSQPAAEDASADLATLENRLTPAAVWLILTDLYFEDPRAQVARAVVRAQRGLRWVILLDLDNWPHECSVLGNGARRIEGPGLGQEGLEVEIDDSRTRQVRGRIEAHKARFHNRIRRGGLTSVHWSWPGEKRVDLARLFLDRFYSEAGLGAPLPETSMSLLQGLVLGALAGLVILHMARPRFKRQRLSAAQGLS